MFLVSNCKNYSFLKDFKLISSIFINDIQLYHLLRLPLLLYRELVGFQSVPLAIGNEVFTCKNKYLALIYWKKPLITLQLSTFKLLWGKFPVEEWYVKSLWLHYWVTREESYSYRASVFIKYMKSSCWKTLYLTSTRSTFHFNIVNGGNQFQFDRLDVEDLFLLIRLWIV